MTTVGNRAVKRRLKFVLGKGRGYWRGSASIKAGRRFQRAKDLLAGFDPREADWYRQIRGDTDGVISNAEREHELHGLNGHYAYVLDNKAVFGELLGLNGLPTPRLFACHYGGCWHWSSGGEEALREHFADTGRFVMKPTLGSKGRAIQIGRSLDVVAAYRGEDAILTGFVEQAGYAQAIFPGALNTIRFPMLRDGAGGPLAAAAIHRFGTVSSAPVDNFSAGGLVAKVDLETGGLSEAITIAPDNRVVRHAVHPDTGGVIAGTTVPHWQGVLDLVMALGRAFPYLAYVGWDIAVTEKGPVVIEGNAHPSLRFFQLYDRLLDDPRLRPILARYIARARWRGVMPLLDVLRHRWRLLRHLWELERRGNRRLPNIALTSKGFLSSRAWLYPFDRFDPSLFLTDIEIEARLPRLNAPEASGVLGDKQRFHQWAASAGVQTARLKGIFVDGLALGPDGLPLRDEATSGQAFIAKPVDGSGGRDVRIVTSLDALPRTGRFVLEEVLAQHDYAKTIFPHAVNTIRVMVGQRPGGEAILIGAAHRFGTERSAPTDNFKACGIVSLVDLGTGRLSEAVVDLGGPGRRTPSHHPATNAPIAGVIVQQWQSVLALAVTATRGLPRLCYVGWDIAVTPSGPVVIEGNAGLANPNLVQFHEPVLLRPEVRWFFAESGVLSPSRLKRLDSRLRQGTTKRGQ